MSCFSFLSGPKPKPIVAKVWDKAQDKAQEKVPAHILEKRGAAAGAGGVWIAAAASKNPNLVASSGIVASHAGKKLMDVPKYLGGGPRGVGIKAMQKCGGLSNASIILPVGLLGVDFATNIWNFCDGKVDGKTCYENCMRSYNAFAGGLLAGWAAAEGGAVAGGAVAGPIGAVVGGVVGGIAGGVAGHWAASEATDKFIDSLLGGDRDQRARVRDAYLALELNINASPKAVKDAYDRLSAKYDQSSPKKDKDAYLKVQIAYEILRKHFEDGAPQV